MNRKTGTRLAVYGGLLAFGLWVFGFFDRGAVKGPAAEPASAVVEPSSPPQFVIVDWQLIPATAMDKAKVVGEVRNTGKSRQACN